MITTKMAREMLTDLDAKVPEIKCCRLGVRCPDKCCNVFLSCAVVFLCAMLSFGLYLYQIFGIVALAGYNDDIGKCTNGTKTFLINEKIGDIDIKSWLLTSIIYGLTSKTFLSLTALYFYKINCINIVRWIGLISGICAAFFTVWGIIGIVIATNNADTCKYMFNMNPKGKLLTINGLIFAHALMDILSGFVLMVLCLSPFIEEIFCGFPQKKITTQKSTDLLTV